MMSNRRFPHLDLAMDGLISKGPSSGNRTPTPSRGGILPPVGSGAFGVDPPRPAKEGYEWVWFPAGYCAERELRTPVSRSPGGRNHPEAKTWKWRTRSAKSQSAPDFESRGVSPKTLLHTLPGPKSQSPSHLPQSPFLSEEAHVHSLQHPGSGGAFNPENEWLTPKHRPRYQMSEVSEHNEPETPETPAAAVDNTSPRDDLGAGSGALHTRFSSMP